MPVCGRLLLPHLRRSSRDDRLAGDADHGGSPRIVDCFRPDELQFSA
jgi:hypothetical protein